MLGPCSGAVFATVLALALPVISGASKDIPITTHDERYEYVGEITDTKVPLFVINLEYRNERLEHLEEQLGGLNYTRINAVDPHLANEELHAKKAKVNNTYLDPRELRRIKIGEVGCALSHLKAWETIATTLPTDEYAVVLEDDAEIDSDVVQGDVHLGDHLDSIAAAASEHDADFVYLAYKSNDDEQQKVVDGLFSSCIPSPWSLAYMIRSKAARKLAEDAESYRMNLVPTAEYLPIVLGTLDAMDSFSRSAIGINSTAHCSAKDDQVNGLCHGSMDGSDVGRMDPRYSNVRLSCLSLNERIFWPSDSFEVRSDTEMSSVVYDVPQDHNDGLIVLTVATDESHFAYKNLRRSTEYFGYHLITLGSGQEWTGGSLDNGSFGGVKLIWSKLFLDHLRDTDKDEGGERVIVFTDGYDTMFNLGPAELLERFLAHPSDVVFGAETQCWPNYDLCSEYENLLEEYGDETLSYLSKFLNSGNYIGRAKHLRELFEDFNGAPDDDDQEYCLSKLVEQMKQSAEDGNLPDFSVGLDLRHDLFQTMNAYPIDGWEIHDGTFTNTITGSYPVIVHGNGVTKRVLVGIGNYISGGYDEYYGTRQHVLMNKEEVDIYPLAIGIFSSATLFEREFLEGVASLDVDWAQVSLHVYYPLGNSQRRVLEEIGAMFSNVTQVAHTSECLARSHFLETAHQSNARFAFMLDSDVLLERATTVLDLARWNETVVAGHAKEEHEERSNFWSVVCDEEGYFEDSFDYLDIVHHERVGLWQVPFASSLLLFRADVFQAMATIYAENEDQSEECSRRVSFVALDHGIPLFVDNRALYGTLLPEKSLVDPDDVRFPKIHEIEASPKLMAKRHMVQDYENVELNRADLFQAMATIYSQNEDHSEECSRRVSFFALDFGTPLFVDESALYDTPLPDDVRFPELHEIEASPKLWAQRYMVQDYENVELKEVCPDVYGAVLFSPRFCRELILMAEGMNSWASGDHHDDSRLDGAYKYVDTQDVQKLDWETQWTTILQDILAPFVLQKYEGITFDGEINVAFLARFIINGQRELEPHTDGSTVTTTVLLNDGFTGGGVEFTRYNCTHRSTTPGFFLMYPGSVTHNLKANPITSGSRYELVSFNE